MKSPIVALSSIMLLWSAAAWPAEEKVIVKIPRLTVEAGQKMAKAAMEECRKAGMQIGVTVVDRGGHPLIMLRDTLAPDLTLEVSRQKAYTAMSFNTATSALENRFTKPFQVAKIDGLVMAAGGVPIQAAGNIVGGIGVSGAPTGEQDEKCAQAGIKSIAFELESAQL